MFSYPMRWRTLLDDPAAHLKNVVTPMLVVQGERDDQADLEELQPIVEGLGERHSEGH